MLSTDTGVYACDFGLDDLTLLPEDIDSLLCDEESDLSFGAFLRHLQENDFYLDSKTPDGEQARVSLCEDFASKSTANGHGKSCTNPAALEDSTSKLRGDHVSGNRKSEKSRVPKTPAGCTQAASTDTASTDALAGTIHFAEGDVDNFSNVGSSTAPSHVNVTELKERCSLLQVENCALKAELERLRAENLALSHALTTNQRASGSWAQAPPVPSPCAPTASSAVQLRQSACSMPRVPSAPSGFTPVATLHAPTAAPVTRPRGSASPAGALPAPCAPAAPLLSTAHTLAAHQDQPQPLALRAVLADAQRPLGVSATGVAQCARLTSSPGPSLAASAPACAVSFPPESTCSPATSAAPFKLAVNARVHSRSSSPAHSRDTGGGASSDSQSSAALQVSAHEVASKLSSAVVPAPIPPAALPAIRHMQNALQFTAGLPQFSSGMIVSAPSRPAAPLVGPYGTASNAPCNGPYGSPAQVAVLQSAGSVPAPAAQGTGAKPTGKKRGRPPGSKNKPKAQHRTTGLALTTDALSSLSKRSKTALGAAVLVVVALCCVVLFVGPLLPQHSQHASATTQLIVTSGFDVVSASPGRAWGGSRGPSRTLAALPDAATDGAGATSGRGHGSGVSGDPSAVQDDVTTGSMFVRNSTSCVHVAGGAAPAIKEPEFVCNRTSCVHVGATGGGAGSGTARRMHMRDNLRSSEKLALSTLRALAPLALDVPDLAPVALSSAGVAPQGQPAAANFEDIAGEAMHLAGLLKPGSCRQVFSSGAGGLSAADKRLVNLAKSQTLRVRGGLPPLVPLPAPTSDGKGAPPVPQLPSHHQDAVLRGDASRDRAPLPMIAPPHRAVDLRAGLGLSAVEVYAGQGALGSERARSLRRTDGDAHDGEQGPWGDESFESANRSSAQRKEQGGESHNATDGGYIVSVMLPVRHTDAEDAATLTALQQLYVVLLKPSKQYITFACDLAMPVYV